MKLKPLVITACVLSAGLLVSFLLLCISCLSVFKKKHDVKTNRKPMAVSPYRIPITPNRIILHDLKKLK